MPIETPLRLYNVTISGIRYDVNKTLDVFHDLFVMGTIDRELYDHYNQLFTMLGTGLHMGDAAEFVPWPYIPDILVPLTDFMTHFGYRIPGGPADPIILLDDSTTSTEPLTEEDIENYFNDPIYDTDEEYIEDEPEDL